MEGSSLEVWVAPRGRSSLLLVLIFSGVASL